MTPIGFTPRNLSYLLFKRRWVFAGVFGAALFLYVVLVVPKPAQYESTAALMVKVVDQDLVTPDLISEQQGRQALTSASLAKQIVNSEQVIITSPNVVSAALQHVGIGRVYPKLTVQARRKRLPLLDLAVDHFTSDLAVQLNNDTNILTISVWNQDPAVARSTLQALLDATVDKQATIMRDPRLSFLERKLVSLKGEADGARAALLAFKKRTQITSFDEERSLLLRQRDETQLQLSQLEASMVGAKSRSEALRQTLRKTPHAIVLSDENDRAQRQLDEARARLTAARARYEVAKQRFTRNNPELADQAAQLATARQNFRELSRASMRRVRTGANPVAQRLSGDLSDATAQFDANRSAATERERQLTQINGRLHELDVNEATLRDLEHRLDIADKDYRAYLERVQSARIMSDMNRAGISNLSVVQAPTLPYQPSRPRKLLLLALTLFAGLAAGLSACIFLEMLDDRVSLPEQLEEVTGVPVLVTVKRREAS